MRNAAPLAVALLVAIPSLAVGSNAPKVGIRVLNASISADVEGVKESGLAVGGLELQGAIFPVRWLALGARIGIVFNGADRRLLLLDPDLFVRAYFWGVGTTQRDDYGEGVHQHSSRFAGYVGTSLNRTVYYPRASTIDLGAQTSYTEYSTRIRAGVAWRFSLDFEAELEAVYTLFRFASDGAAIGASVTGLSIGVNYAL